MMTLTDFFELPFDDIDPAAAALWSAHPDGPPPDVYEPPFDEAKARTRGFLLEAFGMEKAQTSCPHLFEAGWGDGPC